MGCSQSNAEPELRGAHARAGGGVIMFPRACAPYPQLGILPTTVSDPAEALERVKRDGAVIVTGVGRTAEDARLLGHRIFGDSVLAIPDAAEVREGGIQDRRPAGLTLHTRSNLHTDGFSYGNLYPDYFLLLCERDSPEGGESFVMDGAALLEWAATQPGGPEFVERLQRVAIDQTEPGKRNATGPMVGRSDSGRVMFRRFPEQQPTHDASDPERDWAMIAAWHTLIDDLSLFCPRFKLEPGQAVVIDNYRLFHGRESYSDISRCMWRLWVWTTAGQGVPEGLLHSDSRFAGVTP